MELEWEARPTQHRAEPRTHWHDAQQQPPVSFSPPQHPSPSSLNARRRSSAAAARPAGPPPNLPIPSLPTTHPVPLNHAPIPDPPDNSMYPSASNSISRGSRSSSFARPSASPNLSAVAAFSQIRQASSSAVQNVPPSLSSSLDDLSDPPPQSYLPPSSFRPSDRTQDTFPQPGRTLLAPPSEHSLRSENRPSSRRALTRALELAREAVQLDSTNDNPEAAVNAYAQSVALLSEVMERVRNGEDSTTDSHRRRRRRSVAAQEEEVRRLQNIHDTYADRMNILSIIYSIPAVPYPTSSLYGNTTISTDSATSTSPTTSASPSSDNSPHIPQQVYTPYIPEDSAMLYSNHTSNYADVEDSRDSDAVYTLDESVLIGSTISGLPATQHPYSVQYNLPQSLPTHPAPVRTSMQPNALSSRRSRTSSNLPPKPPPPISSLPPAPAPIDPTIVRSDSQGRGGDGSGHRRTPSNLVSLEEENEDVTSPQTQRGDDNPNIPNYIQDTPRTSKRESPPLPPLPSPTSEVGFVPRTQSFSKPPPSPRLQTLSTARPRAVSQLPLRHEPSAPQLNTTNQIVASQRPAPPSTRSASPAESTTSIGSIPQSKSVISSVQNGHTPGRSRSFSQPGRRPSISSGSGRVSPDQRPPLPNPLTNGTPRKVSVPSKLNPNLPSLQLDSLAPYPAIGFPNLPTTPVSPLPPAPPTDPLLKPYHMMNLLKNTMITPTGGYVTRRLHVPQEVWSQGGAKLTGLDEKIRVVNILCSALEDLQASSADHFGAGSVTSGLALGIGSIGRKEADAWLSKLEEFSNVCDHVVANFGKKLGVGEGFVSRKPTWGGKLFSRFDKFTNGKNLDSPAAYVQGLKRLFDHAQLLDEHTRAILSQPIAPAYNAFPLDIRGSAEQKLKRFSEFFASVVLTFVIRDLSQLLDKYVKKCEKWLAE
ncbi:hypothetical protein BDN70DRAFT_878069 [Pholiota conissans]|uniref:MIT domain-containing protein n=1 Tax=Pholiota conissans TaxID=109636 RepID=A0A9P6D1B5_9AGAR|nr:hypothetical protein BDN70DRAFT_878069 [Pholiota conissans]